MLASGDLNRRPSITVGILGPAIVIAIFFAGVLVDRPTLGYALSLWDRETERLFDVSRLSLSVPSCPDPGGSWWFQGTLLCTTTPASPDVAARSERGELRVPLERR
jgi:hypothetical protein